MSEVDDFFLVMFLLSIPVGDWVLWLMLDDSDLRK
jgi:hypothetical protein